MKRLIFALVLTSTTVIALAADVTGQVRLASGRLGGNAVVYLEGGPKSTPLSHYVVDQKNREFIPHISVVTVGTTVDFPNNDTVFHNVFAEYQAKRFDLGMYPRGSVKKQKFDKPGLVAMMCSVHSEMGAFIMVVDTPYYTVADREGNFTLKDVKPGTYTLRVWHESGQVESKSITVTDQNTVLEVRTARH
jgi:plastocyanin